MQDEINMSCKKCVDPTKPYLSSDIKACLSTCLLDLCITKNYFIKFINNKY